MKTINDTAKAFIAIAVFTITLTFSFTTFAIFAIVKAIFVVGERDMQADHFQGHEQ